ncbi:hypothetical protein ACNO7T_20300 [Vibrio campbellii]
MSFDDKANSIRNSLRNYTTESLVNLLLQRLHSTNNEHPGKDFTWISCLLLEWALEVKPYKYARNATEHDLSVELNRLWRLQTDASNIENTKNIWLSMRTMIIQQVRFQNAQITHMYFLVRLHTILTKCCQSPATIQQFEDWNEIKFSEFFEIAIFFISRLMKRSGGDTFIPYNELVRFLYPAYSLDTIEKFLRNVGGSLRYMKSSAEERREKLGKVKATEFFAEPALLARPLLNTPIGVSTPHSYIASIGISEYVLRTFKNSDKERDRFRKRFTKAFESYLALVFDLQEQAYVTEAQLEKTYKRNGTEGKKVDFILENNVANVFIDAKGVEPHQMLLLTSDPKIFKDKLRDHVMKGIQQASECASILASISYPNLVGIEKRYALITTHQDFFIADGTRLAEYLGEEHSEALIGALGDSLKLENVFIASISDVEGIIDLCKHSKTTVDQFFAYCAEQQSDRATSKLTMRQHITEYGKLHKMKRTSPIGSQAITDDFEEIHAKLVSKMNISQDYWRSIGEQNLEAGIHEFLTNLRVLEKVAI